MNWRTVLYLVRVDMKSGRLLRGQKKTKYNVTRNRLFNYVIYGVALAIGVGVGFLAQYIYYVALASDAGLQLFFNQGYFSFLFSLPTMVLVYTLVFTMLQQIQRSGVRFTSQAPYWLPVTWEEHTLASILAGLLGFPLISVTFISSAILVFSLFVGQALLAAGAVLTMVAAAFMASAITEVFRILLVRFTGAVYKSTGRAAVWVRSLSFILFVVVFYIIYFYITTGTGAITFVQTVASVQTSAWFVPFVWLGMTLSSLMTGLLLQGTAFLVLSLLFIAGLVFLGVVLNKHFGLYEPPAITISRGKYAPKTGFLGRLPFSSVEVALLRKDLKAFTRRRELMIAFIIPIVVLIVPVMQSLNMTQSTQGSAPFSMLSFFMVFTTLFPASIMAISLGSLMIGEEGHSIWRIYASPVSAKNLVRSKYAFILFFSLIILPITGAVGFFIYHPTLQAITTLALESIFIVFALGALSLANGIKGADFTEVPRPRMIRPSRSLFNVAACLAAGLGVLAPLILYKFPVMLGLNPFIDLYLAVGISAIITVVLTFAFYKLSLTNAEELLTKAET